MRQAQQRVHELWEQGRKTSLALETDVEATLHRASEAGRPPKAFEALILF